MEVINKFSYEENIIQLRIVNAPKHPKMIANIFDILRDCQINIDMISQVSVADQAQIEITCQEEDQLKMNQAIVKINDQFKNVEIYQDRTLFKLAFGGQLMEETPGAAAKIFDVLGENNIHFLQVTTSKRTVSILIKKKDKDLALTKVKEAFSL